MNISRLIQITFAFALIALSGSEAAAQKHYKELTYPPLNEIQVPEAVRVTLKNGIIVYMVEDHSLPLINLRARIGVGSIDEPGDKIGLAAITGAVMRSGGTATMSGDEIDEEMEGIGASIETGIGRASGFASMSVLKENLGTALPILVQVLMNPAFPEDKIELQKVQIRSGISRRNDDAQSIAGREFSKLIYGAESVFARHSEFRTIDAITRDDLVAFHKRYFLPNNVMVGISGDFDAKAMGETIAAAFASWKKGKLNRAKTPTLNYTYDSSVHYIEKTDVNQSSIYLGHIGGLRNNPDYFALQVMNDILSGGFSGRLMKNVRSDQGLAYAVFGRYSANYDYPGLFYVGCMTQSSTTVEAIRSLLREVERMIQEDVSDEELALAKESFLNSFVFNFDTKGEVIDRQMTYEYYDYPKDFLERTKTGIEKVTSADVRRVAQTYLKPDNVRILVVGNGNEFGTPLASLGAVNEIDISVTGPEVEQPEATEDDIAVGRAILNQAIEAAGGSDAIKRIQSIQEKGQAIMVTPQGEVEIGLVRTMAFPDRYRVVMDIPQGQMVQIMNSGLAWLVTPMGSQPAPPSVKENLINNTWQDLTYLYRHSDVAGLQVQYLGSEDINGTPTEVILFSPPDALSFRMFFDASTMLPIKRSSQNMTPNGPEETVEFLSDYRNIDGILLPFKTLIMSNGQKIGESTVVEIIINPTVPDDMFTVER